MHSDGRAAALEIDMKVRTYSVTSGWSEPADWPIRKEVDEEIEAAGFDLGRQFSVDERDTCEGIIIYPSSDGRFLLAVTVSSYWHVVIAEDVAAMLELVARYSSILTATMVTTIARLAVKHEG